MARRENQGLHVGLICMVVLSVLLLGLTYFFYSSADTLNTRVADLDKTLATERGAKSKAADENTKFRQMIGASLDAPPEDVDTQFQQDLSLIGLPEESRSYSKALQSLVVTYFETQRQLEDLTKREAQLNQQLDEVRKEEKARADAAEQARDQAVQDRDAQKKLYNDERARINAEKEQLSSDLKSSRDKVLEAQQQLKAAQTKFATDLAQVQLQLDKMKTQLDQYQKETFDVPDGRITYYNPRSNLVTVNLGSADGLRPQTTFGVFDASDNNLTRAVKKGTIEIQRILDPHRAEALVIDEVDIVNPIITGDLIYTPLWAPGGRLHFGIIGTIDLDGDGRDDREQLRRLIRISGGVIDAEDTGPSGRQVGELSIQTRYLIVGDSPEADSRAGRRASPNYTKLDQQATQLGLERITVQQVLNFLGFKALSAGQVQEVGAE